MEKPYEFKMSEQKITERDREILENYKSSFASQPDFLLPIIKEYDHSQFKRKKVSFKEYDDRKCFSDHAYSPKET